MMPIKYIQLIKEHLDAYKNKTENNLQICNIPGQPVKLWKLYEKAGQLSKMQEMERIFNVLKMHLMKYNRGIFQHIIFVNKNISEYGFVDIQFPIASNELQQFFDGKQFDIELFEYLYNGIFKIDKRNVEIGNPTKTTLVDFDENYRNNNNIFACNSMTLWIDHQFPPARILQRLCHLFQLTCKKHKNDDDEQVFSIEEGLFNNLHTCLLEGFSLENITLPNISSISFVDCHFKNLQCTFTPQMNFVSFTKCTFTNPIFGGGFIETMHMSDCTFTDVISLDHSLVNIKSNFIFIESIHFFGFIFFIYIMHIIFFFI